MLATGIDMHGGSNIIAVTKSGGKDFHGLASYFVRNEDFDANNFFNNRNGQAVPRYRLQHGDL